MEEVVENSGDESEWTTNQLKRHLSPEIIEKKTNFVAQYVLSS